MLPPALRVTLVPGDSAPANDADGCTLAPVTLIVNSEAIFVPPLSLMTCLITVSVAAWSSLVIVHTADCPFASVMLLPLCEPVPVQTHALAV